MKGLKWVATWVMAAAAVPGMAQDFCQSGNPPVDVQYPIVAAEQRAVGIAVMQVELDDDGNPANVKMLRGTGNDLLDATALAAAKGQPVFCTDAYAGTSYIDAISFDIDAKRTNKQVKYGTRVSRIIEPLHIGAANVKRLGEQCIFERDPKFFIYPRDAIAGHVQGTLMLEVRGANKGQREVRVVDGSGDSRLDATAVNIARNAKVDCAGKEVPAVFRIPMRFYMDESYINTKEGAGANRITTYASGILQGFYNWADMDRARAETGR